MNIMITGCAGFIGSHACDFFLEKKYNVIGVDKFTYAADMSNLDISKKNKESFSIIKCDINETEKLLEVCKKKKIECILNFAAETHVDNSIKNCQNFVHSNIAGVISLLKICKILKIKLLQVSTDEVYGDAKENESFFEYAALNPKNPYSASKASAENFIKAANNTYGTDYIIVRPSNNFGPRQHYEKFIPKIIRSILQGIKIPVYGSGKQIREWTYVKDTVSAIEYILSNGHLNTSYNITSEHKNQNIDIICNIASLMKKNEINELIDYVSDRPGHDFMYAISNEKLKNLGYNIYTNHIESLKGTIAYYKKKEGK